MPVWHRPVRLFAPDDNLTLLYYFRAKAVRPLEYLHAARALIQNKPVAKTEMNTDHRSFPHARDQLETIYLVEKLSLADCRRLLSYSLACDFLLKRLGHAGIGLACLGLGKIDSFILSKYYLSCPIAV